MRQKLKITPNTPKNESGLTQLIKMGKSIRQIWVKIKRTDPDDTALRAAIRLDSSKCNQGCEVFRDNLIKYFYTFLPG